MSSSLAIPVQKVIAAESGGYCGKPECRTAIIAGSVFLGEFAHIAGERPNSERYDASMSDAERNASANLIALCPTCHALIDKPGAAAEFSVARLQGWKADTKARLERLARTRIGEVGRAAMQLVVKGLLNGALAPASDEEPLTLVAPTQKIQINELSRGTEDMITRAMARFQEFDAVLKHINVLDSQASAKLIDAVVRQYRDQAAWLRGDDLFRGMVSWARQGEEFTPESIAAAAVVIAYFFERCDIFERV